MSRDSTSGLCPKQQKSTFFVDVGVDCTDNFFRKMAIEKTILRIVRPSAFSHSLAILRSADWLRKCLLAELAEMAGHHPDISFGWGCGLAEYREDQRAACERLRHGEWLLDRPDRSLDVKQRSYDMN